MQYKTIFVSDIHLGLPESYADRLVSFLTSNNFDTLYIVGDLFDIWAMELHPFWYKQNNRLVSYLLDLAKTKSVIYIIGNYDEALNMFAGQRIGNITVLEEAPYTTVSGRKLLVIHGSQFDSVVGTHARFSLYSSWFNEIFYLLDPLISWIYRRLGLYKHWSLAGAANDIRNHASYLKSFRQMLTMYAKKKGYDGVIVGHLHQPEISVINGILYYNDGDVITSLTALVENLDGSLEIASLPEILKLSAEANELERII